MSRVVGLLSKKMKLVGQVQIQEEAECNATVLK